MTRRDGRPLVTEFPMTAEDWIDVVLDGEVPEGAVVCRRPSASRGADERFDEGEWYA